MAHLQVFSPYDRSLLADLPMHGDAHAEAALARAHALYEDRSAWLSRETRIQILTRLSSLLRERRETLALDASREGGKPLRDSLVEIERAESGVVAACNAIGRLTGVEVPMGLDASSRGRWATTYREPRGVVLSISAFNHPFNLLIHQVITALAAGCPVLVKPSAATPLCCISLLRLLEESGLPAGYCQLLLTDHELTERLVADDRLAFLSFIGSSAVGWRLRSHLSPGADCLLEHGGVAPVIVDETADLDDAVPLLIKGAFYHAGQVCVSVQRIFAHTSILAELSERMISQTERLIVGDPCDLKTDVGPLIRPGEVDRVEEWVDEARASGGKILCGGRRMSDSTFAPTILLDPDDRIRLSRQEIFGPVVAVYAYDDLDEAITRANLRDAYFQAAFFTNRLDRALTVGRKLHGTAVMVNDHTAFRVDWMPFGGHRKSGLGLGGIEATVREMTIERMLVFRQKPTP